MYQFEKLDIWEIALDLIEQVYELTKKFPDEERFGLTNQLRRSVVSIALNIAEGRGAGTDTEFKRFLRISLRSSFETIAGFKIAIRLRYLTGDDCKNLFAKADEIGAKINSLINYLKKKTTKDKRLETNL